MPLTRPLTNLLSATPTTGLVAFSFSAEPHPTHAHLVADVLALSQRFAGARGQRWLVETDDAYHVAVALLAAAQVGARIVLPPNFQPRVLEGLRGQCDLVLGDQNLGEAALGELISGNTASVRPTPGDGVGRALASVDRDAPWVELYTSGSSGPGKRVTKALRHLEDEVVELERTLGGDLPPDAAVLATVPVHHLYGLLFRVLWPLASGRPFARASVLLPEELLTRVAATSAAILISSPAHLRHLATSARLGEQAGRLRAVFSSGGPLDTATALSTATQLGHAPIEIFGSTETGGVAWRRATIDEPSPRWTLLPTVEVERRADDGCLVVTSPFVTPQGGSDEANGCWAMGDKIELESDGFRLLGRSDRIAKIGENSIALPEMESHLAEHIHVEIAAVGTYTGRSGPRIAALVVLSAEGRLALAQLGRRALQKVLAEHLQGHWERIALPRRWRFRDVLPMDARGKLGPELFETEILTPVQPPRQPLLLGRAEDDDGAAILQFVVPHDLAYFDGHYDTFPLVPGAVQVQWVMSQITTLLDRPVRADRMEALKFRNVLRPAQTFTMRLRVEGERVSFSLADGARVFASGRITLAA